MPRLLFIVLGFVLSGAIKRLLLGAGLGLLSMTVLHQFFDWYMQRFTHYGSPPTANYGGVFGLLAIARIPECISILMGAVVARLTINAMTLTLAKSTK